MHCVAKFTFTCMFLTITTQERTGPLHKKVIACHFVPSHSVNLNETFKIETVNLNLCTHVIYFHRALNTSGDDVEVFQQLAKLRQKYPHLKIIASVWGRTLLKDYLNVMPNNRQEFIENITHYIFQQECDGLDLFWDDLEQTQKKYSRSVGLIYVLLEKLKQKFMQSNLLLTSTFFSSMDFLNRGAPKFDFFTFSKHQNFINFMPVNYDKYHSINDTMTELHILNVQQKIEDLIKMGVPASKIIMGVTFAGVLFTAKANVSAGIRDDAITFSRIVNYNFICERLSSNETKSEISYDTISALTTIVENEEQQKKILVFEGSQSIANRMWFVVKRGLAGAAAITINMDHFRGKCRKNIFTDFQIKNYFSDNISKRDNNNFKLLKTINEAITIALNQTEQRNIGSTFRVYNIILVLPLLYSVLTIVIRLQF